LKVSANVKIAMQCFENLGWGKCPPSCAPGSGDDSEVEYLFSAKAFSSQAQFKKGYLVGR